MAIMVSSKNIGESVASLSRHAVSGQSHASPLGGHDTSSVADDSGWSLTMVRTSKKAMVSMVSMVMSCLSPLKTSTYHPKSVLKTMFVLDVVADEQFCFCVQLPATVGVIAGL